MKNQLELIASKEFSHYDDMYKIVDFFNKNMNETKLVIGFTEKDNIQKINIYKEE